MQTFKTLSITDATECWQILKDLETTYGHPIGGEWTFDKLMGELASQYGLGVFAAPIDQAPSTPEPPEALQAFCLYRQPPETIEITLLATRPRHHRTGAMRALIRSLIEDLAPGHKVWLEVHAGNLPAISLYESLGFKLVGERKDYYFDGGKALLYEYKPLQ